MFLSGKVRVSLVSLVVAGGAVAAVTLGTAGPAVGQSSPPIQLQIQVNSPATLVAKGAGVNVSITASCSGQVVEPASISVELTEAVKKDLAIGSGATTIDCTGATQTIEVLVVAESGKAFKKGAAIADANFSACTVGYSYCADQQVEPTIEIGN